MRQSVAKPLYGRGVNSIPIRFAAMSVVLSGGAALAFFCLFHSDGGVWSWLFLLPAVTAVAFLPAALIYVASRGLTTEIAALQASTEAIAAGDLSRPVEVDCRCEIGGLAESFRKMVARLNENIAQMNARAHTDPVTGLPNRAVLDHLFALAEEHASCRCALLFIDLDGFKGINDSLGHEGDDDLLRQVTSRIATEAFGRPVEEMPTGANDFGELTNVCLEEVFFARFTGDEFVALIPSAQDASTGARVAQAILAALEKPFVVGAQEVRVSASVGVARAPMDARGPRELLPLADIAMLEAKKRGKNAYVLFDPALRARALEKNSILSELRHAIDDGGLFLHYQPKIDAKTLKPAGVEALLRWVHPTLGQIPPESSFPSRKRPG